MFKKAILKKTQKVTHVTKQLKKQFRVNLVTAVLAAFGLVIALAWRDVIQSTVDAVLKTLQIENGTDLISKLIVALLVTLISVIGILIFSKYKPKD